MAFDLPFSYRQLLAKAISPENVINRVTAILKKFNGPEMEHKIVNYGGTRIQLPSTTRWCSNRNSMMCFLNNLPHMKIILSETEENGFVNIDIPGSIAALLFDQAFLRSVQDAVDLLDSICKLINLCQDPQSSIAVAAREWLSLKFPEGYIDAQEKLKKRPCLIWY